MSPRNATLCRNLLLAALVSAGLQTACNKTDLRDGPTLDKLQGGGGGPVGPGPGPCDTPLAPADLLVVINEAMFLNETTLPDVNGNFGPWVELYNPTQQTFHLGGVTLSLTDTFFSTSESWTFPCVPESELGPGEFLVLFLNGDTLDADDFTVSWQPDPLQGQWIFLNEGSSALFTDPTDNLPDISRGRIPDGSNTTVVLLLEPTPGAPNSAPLIPPQQPFLRGDANGDGVIDGLDVDALLAYVSGTVPLPSCPDRLDVNDNGVVNVIDVTFLINALQPGGPPIPPPSSAPGRDPSPDSLDCF